MQVGYSLQPVVKKSMGVYLPIVIFLMFQLKIQSRHLPYFFKVLLCYSIPLDVIHV